MNPPLPSKNKGALASLLLTAVLLATLVLGSIYFPVGQGEAASPNREVLPADSTSNTTNEQTQTVTTTIPASTSTAKVQATMEPDGFRLVATVPNEELAEQLRTATEVGYGSFGAHDVTVNSEVGDAAWLKSIPEAITTIRSLNAASLEMNSKGIRLSGRALNEGEIANIEQILGSISGLSVFRDEIDITDLRNPSLVVSSDGNSILLNGAVPSNAAKESIIETAQELFGENQVTDLIKVDTEVYWVFWMGIAPDFMRFLDPFANYEIRLGGKRISGALRSNLTFDGVQPVESPNNQAIFDNLRAILAQGNNLSATVVGYADTEADEAANIELSRQKAQVVIDLITQDSRINNPLASSGKGSNLTAAANDPASSEILNQRVEILFAQQVLRG